jgi:uncharacterized membrane-anchored protein
MKKRPIYAYGLIGALALQLGLLAYIVYDHVAVLRHGKEIRLAVIPIDPRDMLRGDYVILSYDISRIHSGRVATDRQFFTDDTVYVSLAQDGGRWKAAAITAERPRDGTFLRGHVVRWANVSAESGDDCSSTGNQCVGYDIDYNIEKFFVPEGTGREIENMRNDQRVSVDVAVGDDGRAALKRLLIDDVPRYDEPVF